MRASASCSWAVLLLVGTLHAEPLSSRLVPLYQRMPAPRAGDWLSQHREPGQTLAEYKDENKKLNGTVLYLQPVGAFTAAEERIVADVEVALAVFFQRPVKRLPSLPLPVRSLPKDSWRINLATRQPQILTHTILDALVPRLPKDALGLIALTATDLWPGGEWNYVFGEAAEDAPVGVWSLHRFGDPATGYDQVLLRAIKLALHETGHMLGLRHCTAYRCGMNGTNNLQETDRCPLAFCPVCEEKLWWALGLDPQRRYEPLIAFAETHRMEREATFWKAVRERLRAR